MNKAEKRNEKRKLVKQNTFQSSKCDWRTVKLEDNDGELSSDTEDEDDRDETEKFVSLMDSAKQRNKKEKVKISWVNGRTQFTSIEDEECLKSSPNPKHPIPSVFNESQTMIQLREGFSQL